MVQPQTNDHRRRSIRLPSFDYTDYGAYFITVVTNDRRPLFGDIVSGEMLLNHLGEIVQAEWRQTTIVRPSVDLDAFVVMPNHIHGIVWLAATDEAQKIEPGVARRFGAMPARSLGATVRGFKAAVTRRVRALRQNPSFDVWQSNYYERIIRNEPELDAIRRYIEDNPKQWALDREYVADDRSP